MHVIKVDNVCAALPQGVEYLLRSGVREPSRAGEVLVAPGPVTTVYTQPQHRVLLSPVRDANPFFHLIEAMWMLAGRDDARFLNNYVKDFGDRFAEPNGRIHGAYGYRWRDAFGFDQLDTVVQKLLNNPQDRQTVVQMWSCQAGLNDLMGKWKDRPCNTHIYFRLRANQFLDMTVCCRSNDLIWGCTGANAVHMGFLQEYMAARLGANIGTYYQVSNNYHAYVSELERLTRRAGCLIGDLPEHLAKWNYKDPSSLVTVPSNFDGELVLLLEALDFMHKAHSNDECAEVERMTWEMGSLENEFLGKTVWPAALAHWYYKMGFDSALDYANKIQAEDWRQACVEWLERRMK